MINDFNDLYATICKEKEIKPKVKVGKYNDLVINANTLDESEWKPALYALSKTTTLHYFKITTRNKYGRLNSANGENFAEIAIMKQPLLGCFFVTIRQLLFNSEILTSLIIDGFPISIDSLNILCSGLAKCRILQNLGFTNCQFEDSYKGLEIVCRLVASHTGLLCLDLTGCGIDEKGVECISKMIKSLRLVRMGELWKQSLRYRHPDPEIFPGLRRITLNKNPMIGDDGFQMIANEILDDLWLKAIDLRDCGITPESLQCISEVLRINSIIQVLDLRDNDIPSDVLEQIRFILKGNSDNERDEDYFSMNTSTTTLYRRNSTTSSLSTKKSKTVVENDKKVINKESLTSMNKACVQFKSEDDLQRVNKLIDTVNRLKSKSVHIIKQPPINRHTNDKNTKNNKLQNEYNCQNRFYSKQNQQKSSKNILDNETKVNDKIDQQKRSHNKYEYCKIGFNSSKKCLLKPKTADSRIGIGLKQRSKSLHGDEFQKKCVESERGIKDKNRNRNLEIPVHRCRTMPLKPVVIKRKTSVC
ncbi:centrosomal protein of 78 kDa-like [Nilaparvata lugens]|uniref:centrosomal protein of 78 kDa-like n=1 Tax=Nilaparvata lugens TaxID=108931 RepID=UPI00193CA0E5|nr:centrosomal protein of 78 kDa-like [Nilaparvata lugens]